MCNHPTMEVVQAERECAVCLMKENAKLLIEFAKHSQMDEGARCGRCGNTFDALGYSCDSCRATDREKTLQGRLKMCEAELFESDCGVQAGSPATCLLKKHTNEYCRLCFMNLQVSALKDALGKCREELEFLGSHPDAYPTCLGLRTMIDEVLK